jgi:hypothetical protein
MIVIAVVAGVVLAIGIGCFVAVDRATKSATKGIVFYTQNANGIPDGTYV